MIDWTVVEAEDVKYKAMMTICVVEEILHTKTEKN